MSKGDSGLELQDAFRAIAVLEDKISELQRVMVAANTANLEKANALRDTVAVLQSRITVLESCSGP